MKNHLKLIIALIISSLLLTSCLEDYLNVSPESGLTEKDVFTNYDNFQKFFDVIYDNYGSYSLFTAFPFHWSTNTRKYTLEDLTDMADTGRPTDAFTYRLGTMYPSNHISSYTDISNQYGWFTPMWRATRVANIALAKVDLIQNATEEEKNDIRAQAYFARGFALFSLFKGWGAMPHVTKLLGADDEWDIARPTKYQTCMSVVNDMDEAVKYFKLANKMRRDPGPGGTLHLNDPEMFRPSGMAAMALRASALLYAASPLNNDIGNVAWENAAKANWEALQTALSLQYELLPWSRYKENFNGVKYSNEQLFFWYAGNFKNDQTETRFLLPGVFNNNKFNSGECPTQNAVDLFETADGYPLKTQAQRDEATALGVYNEQNPYANRDPRLEFTVIYNQSPLTGFLNNKAQLWFQNGTPGELLNQSFTGVTPSGYLLRKLWGGESVKNKVRVDYTTSYIRLAELYLNFAEAANEAYGPTAIVPGTTMSAVDAINVIRSRAGMPNVLSKFTNDKVIFRDRIKNERNVELAYEGHYFYDIRRWMDAPQVYSSKIYGIFAEKLVAPTPQYPTGFKYTRIENPSNRQLAWKEAMYYFPFSQSDYKLLNNFETGPVW